MKLKITTLIIIEEGQVQDIYHSLEDDQDKAYQDLIDQVTSDICSVNLTPNSTGSSVPRTN
jgi:hypothetical protein